MKPRHVLSRWLRKRGYDFIKLDPVAEALEAEYRRVHEFNFIQIGANDGIKFDGLFAFVTSRRCNGVVVEPLTFYYQKLERTYAGFDSIRPLNVAIHKSNREQLIHYPDPERFAELPEWSQGIGSFDFSHHQSLDIPSEAMTSELVRCINFSELLKESGFEQLSLLQIDAEGYDAEIIRLIDFHVIKPTIVKYESKSFDSEASREITTLLQSQGYRLIRQGSDTVAILDGCG